LQRVEDNAFHLKNVSASRRRNAGEGAAGLSNQHASGVWSPEFGETAAATSVNAVRTRHVTNDAFLFVQQKRIALRFPPLSWWFAFSTPDL